MAGVVYGRGVCMLRGVHGRGTCMAGGAYIACVAGQMVTEAGGGTHPTGMHSCYHPGSGPWGGCVCSRGEGGLVFQHAMRQTPRGQMATAADGTYPTGMHSC